MPTDTSHETVLFNDGEGLVSVDLDDLQALGARRLADYLARPLIYQPGRVAVAERIRPIGEALSVVTDGDMSILVSAGTVLRELAADPGSPYPHLLMHRLESDIEIVIADETTGDPRIDVISAKLEYDALDASGGNPDAVSRSFLDAVAREPSSQMFDKRRRTLLTVTLTQGVPGAVPVEPAPPAGEQIIAVVHVAANEATEILPSEIVDRRYPAGYTRIYIPPYLWVPDVAAEWPSVGIFSRLNNVGAVPNRMEVSIHPLVCGGMGIPTTLGEHFHFRQHLRLAALRLAYNLDAGGVCELRSYDADRGSVGASLLATLTGSLTLDGTDRTARFAVDDLDLWVNGLQNPNDIVTVAQGGMSLRVNGNNAADQIYGLWAEYWGM